MVLVTLGHAVVLSCCCAVVLSCRIASCTRWKFVRLNELSHFHYIHTWQPVAASVVEFSWDCYSARRHVRKLVPRFKLDASWAVAYKRFQFKYRGIERYMV